MAGAGSRERGLLRALSRSLAFSSHTSPTASARMRRIHSTARNWALSAPTCRYPAVLQTQLLLRPDSLLRLAPPIRFVQFQRGFASTPAPRHNHLDPPKPGEERKVTFIDKDGESHTFEVADGDNLLDVAIEHDIEMEGACGGSCACSTCHVIVTSDHYDAMEEPDDDENDMLDQAFGLTETSRLGCQVKMSKELDGLVVKLPLMTKNLQASDFQSR